MKEAHTMIEVRDLSFTYGGSRKQAVDTISFTVQKGEIFGFLGPSGAGKSTTQKILIGLLKHYQGSACVLGTEVRDWKGDYYERIGVSFELPNHYRKLTALENLGFFRSLYSGATEDPHHLLDLVGLADDAHTRVGTFSKGMLMRLNFARALLNRPEIIFLDEPTSGMDPVNARKIKDTIRQQQQEGRTMFLTTHNMTDADELCDRIAFLVDGRIATIDTPRALKLLSGERQVRVEYLVNTDAHAHTEQQTFALDGLGTNEAFLSLLRTARLETIHTQEATLESVFIQVTGRKLI